MAKKKQTILSKVYDGFLHIDVFGETVAFSINGDETYKSFLGSLFTFLIAVACFGYFLDNYISMIQFGQTNFQRDEFIYNSKLDSETVNYDLTKFTVAMVFENYTTEEIIKLEDAAPYVQFSAHNVNLQPQGENFYQADSLSLRKCNESDINDLLFEAIDKTWSREKLLNIKDNMLCLDDPGQLDFSGQLKNDKGMFLRIELRTCGGITEDSYRAFEDNREEESIITNHTNIFSEVECQSSEAE